MGLLEDLADQLAVDTLEVAREKGDDTVIEEVSKALGATSTTLQETYLTSIRFRRAAGRGRQVLQDFASGTGTSDET